MKVDRFDAHVRIEGVFVEENSAARKVGHVKSFMKNFVFDILRSLLQRNDMPFPPQFVSRKHLPFHVGARDSSCKC